MKKKNFCPTIIKCSVLLRSDGDCCQQSYQDNLSIITAWLSSLCPRHQSLQWSWAFIYGVVRSLYRTKSCDFLVIALQTHRHVSPILDCSPNAAVVTVGFNFKSSTKPPGSTNYLTSSRMGGAEFLSIENMISLSQGTLGVVQNEGWGLRAHHRPWQRA